MDNKINNTKLVVVSWGFAPQVAGSPILLANLLEEYQGDLEAIVGWDLSARIDPNFKPVCKTNTFKIPNSFLARVFRRLRFKLSFLVDRFVLKHLKRIKPAVVLAIYPNGIFATAAFKACKRLNIPFFIHVHDLWEENEKGEALRYARKWEKEVLLNADRVYCMTSTQQQHYVEKYDIEPAILPHTTSKNLIENAAQLRRESTKHKEEKLILYTGNVSTHMSLDAMKEFIKAIDLMPDHYKVKILINLKEEQLKSLNIYHPKADYYWGTREEAQQLQRDADVLFLPLSHKNGSYHEVKTVFATKTLEYLISGTPILAYSPPYSFHTKSAKERGWAYVVEVDSPEAIFIGIEKLISNSKLGTQIIKNAFTEARNRNASKYADILLNDVENASLKKQ